MPALVTRERSIASSEISRYFDAILPCHRASAGKNGNDRFLLLVDSQRAKIMQARDDARTKKAICVFFRHHRQLFSISSSSILRLFAAILSRSLRGVDTL